MGQPTLVEILREADADVPRALIDVVAEFELQRQKWGPSHDDWHGDGAIAAAAAVLVHPQGWRRPRSTQRPTSPRTA